MVKRNFDTRILEVGKNMSRFVANTMNYGYPNVSFYVPAVIRKKMGLMVGVQAMITIELLGEDFVHYEPRRKLEKI